MLGLGVGNNFELLLLNHFVHFKFGNELRLGRLVGVIALVSLKMQIGALGRQVGRSSQLHLLEPD